MSRWLQRWFEALEDKEREITEQAPEFVSEATKAVATAFLVLQPDGEVRREYRVPRVRQHNTNGDGHANGTDLGDDAMSDQSTPPTSEDLKDGQLRSRNATPIRRQAGDL